MLYPYIWEFFLECIKFLFGRDKTEEFLGFIQNEKRRSNVLTQARTQPFCMIHFIDLGCFQGSRKKPRSFTERNIALYKHKNHFCLG